jgi:8-oxo-dGTP pyrophosphatase MutT (NUDIX family)
MLSNFLNRLRFTSVPEASKTQTFLVEAAYPVDSKAISVLLQSQAMELKKGPWTIKRSNELFKDDFLSLTLDEVTRPDGQPGAYATVRMKPGVAILILDGDDQQVYLTSQFRYGLGNYSIEVVCGGVDEGENPLDAAKREVHEELGIQADEWMGLGRFELDTSIVQNPVDLFLCRKLTFTQPEPDSVEEIQALKAPFPEVVAMVIDGRIVHGPSCVLILKAHQYLLTQKPILPLSIPKFPLL